MVYEKLQVHSVGLNLTYVKWFKYAKYPTVSELSEFTIYIFPFIFPKFPCLFL